MYSHQPLHNIVRDYSRAQGVTHPTDLSYQILRDYNVRYITIENSSPRPVGVAITPYFEGATPPITFSLAGGEIKHLGINSHGSHPQFMWMLDLQTKESVGVQTILRSDANSFVIRDGLNKKFVHFYKRPSYAAAH